MGTLGRLQLERPLAFFDLETTGIDPADDRVVEIAVCRVEPGGARDTRLRRVHPGRPIPPDATAIHGITDADVADFPGFRQIARGLLEILEGCDLAGFNVARFDIPLLQAEFARCGMDLGMDDRRVVDVMTIYQRQERRDLSAAVRFYLDRDHEGAHGAEADTSATLDILEAQTLRYADLPDTVEELDRWCRPSGAVDRSGKFRWKGDDIVFGFGKNRGESLRKMVEKRDDYLDWFLRADFPSDAKQVVKDAKSGRWPTRPGGDGPRQST